MRERVYRTEAIVLRRRDFGEADRLLTLLTPAGKRRVVAKGARKTTSRLAGYIELFTHATVLLAVGRNLDIVTQSAPLHQYEQLRVDPLRIAAAYYSAELIDQLTEEEDENPAIFELLRDVLAALDSSRHIDLILRWFELRLLGYVGYRPQLHYCAVCQEALTEEAARFGPAVGGVVCPRCARVERGTLPMSLGAFKLMRFLQTQSVAAVERLALSEEVCAEVEGLLRGYVRQVMERDLKSSVFLDEVRAHAAEE